MSCLIDVDFDDYYEELHCKIVRARKQWRCGECDDLIRRNKEHEVFVGKIRDEVHVHRTCLTCLSIRKKFCCNWTYEGMFEDICDAIEYDPKLENCFLMMASKEEYEKLVKFVSVLDQDPYGEDENEDD